MKEKQGNLCEVKKRNKQKVYINLYVRCTKLGKRNLGNQSKKHNAASDMLLLEIVAFGG